MWHILLFKLFLEGPESFAQGMLQDAGLGLSKTNQIQDGSHFSIHGLIPYKKTGAWVV